MLKVMLVRPERLQSVGLSTFSCQCGADFLPLMETLFIPDNAEVCLYREARKKDKTYMQSRKRQ